MDFEGERVSIMSVKGRAVHRRQTAGRKKKPRVPNKTTIIEASRMLGLSARALRRIIAERRFIVTPRDRQISLPAAVVKKLLREWESRRRRVRSSAGART